MGSWKLVGYPHTTRSRAKVGVKQMGYDHSRETHIKSEQIEGNNVSSSSLFIVIDEGCESFDY